QFNNAYLQIAHTHRWAKDNRKTNKSAAMLCIAFPAFGVRLLSMRQSIEEQIEWASVALAVAKSNKHLEAQGYMLGRLAVAYMQKGDYPQAVEYFEAAIQIARQQKDRVLEADHLGNLAIISSIQGRYDEAI